MNSERLLEHFERLTDAPDAVARLRRLILDLAVRGKLIEQDPTEEATSELLKRIEAERQNLPKSRASSKLKADSPLSEENNLFELPSSWQWVRLHEITSYIQRGKSPKYATEEGPPVISQKCVQWSGINLEHAKLITQESLSSYEDVRFLRDGDLLWNSTGTGTIGRVARVSSPGEKLVCDSHVTVVRCLLVNEDYVRIWLRSDHVYGSIEQKATGSTNQVELTSQMACNQPVPLPPLGEQARIVAKVDEMMSLCDELEAAQAQRETQRDKLVTATLSQMSQANGDLGEIAGFYFSQLPRMIGRAEHIKQLRQTILSIAVRGRLVPQNPTDQPVNGIRQVTEFSSSLPFDELPSNWFWTKLKYLGKIQGGGTPSKADSSFWNGDILWVSPKDMKQEYIDSSLLKITEKAIENSSVKLIDTGSILFVVRGMILAHSFPVALTTVPCTVNQDMKAITPNIHEMGEFILKALKALKPEVLSMVQRSSHGTCRLESSDYLEMPFPVPPLAEQHRIIAKVDELMALCDELEANLAMMTATRRRLLEATLHEALATSEV